MTEQAVHAIGRWSRGAAQGTGKCEQSEVQNILVGPAVLAFLRQQGQGPSSF